MENEERCAGWNGMRCSSSGMEVVKNCSFLFVCASPPSKHHTEKVDQGWIGYCTKVTDLGKQASGFCQRMEDLMVWLLPKFWIYRLKPAIKRPPKRWKWHQTSPHTYGGGEVGIVRQCFSAPTPPHEPNPASRSTKSKNEDWASIGVAGVADFAFGVQLPLFQTRRLVRCCYQVSCGPGPAISHHWAEMRLETYPTRELRKLSTTRTHHVVFEDSLYNWREHLDDDHGPGTFSAVLH